MKVFLINMDSATDRLAFMKEQLEQNEVEFERIPAVVGKDLPKKIIRSVTSPFMQWCALGRLLNRGEIGCALSHMEIWKKIVDEQLDCACILEDDVTVLGNIKSRLQELENRINQRDNAVYFISSGGDTGLDGILPANQSSAACGYVLSRRAAMFLLDCNRPIVYPCDAWYVWSRWGLKLWKCIPRSIAHWNHKQFGSMGDDYVGDRTIGTRMVHKLKRCLGYPLAMLYRYRKFRKISKTGHVCDST